jgi:nucleotide-binding universal stress UspA family protein
MPSFGTILFAGDFSERSKGPYHVAQTLAEHAGGRVVVLHVVVPVLYAEPSGPPGTAGLPVFFPTDSPAHHAELTDQLRQFYPAPNPERVEYQVKNGDAPQVILQAARELGADLIVLGTHGRSGLDRIVTGSVAENVLRHAECPVLAFRARPEDPELGEIGLVLHPTDFSERSRAALQVARALAQSLDALLLLLRVVPERQFDHMDADWEQLQALEAEVEKDESGGNLRVETRIVSGEPAAEILRTAGEVKAHLIVLGTHGRTGLARLLMGSVAEAIVRDAFCPTVVVKPKHQEP